MTDKRQIIHVAVGEGYTQAEIAELVGLIEEAAKDEEGTGVVVTQDDVRITLIDLPEHSIGNLFISDVSMGPAAYLQDDSDFEDGDEDILDNLEDPGEECPVCGSAEDEQCPCTIEDVISAQNKNIN